MRVVFTVPTIALGEGGRLGFAHKGNPPDAPVYLPRPCACCGDRTSWYIDATAGRGAEIPLCRTCLDECWWPEGGEGDPPRAAS